MTRLHIKPLAEACGELLAPKQTETFPRYQKPFVDYLRVKCKAGHGGAPVANVNRSRRLCGPGYGGHGGNIVLRPTHLVESLLHIDDIVKANNGGDAMDTSRGKHAKHCAIHVPLGVIVRKRVKTEEGYRNVFWHQFLNQDRDLLVARGGRGGLGPSCFKKHDHRLPEIGETTNIELELRLINDVAFIGEPNVGKTSLISALTTYMTRIGPEEGSTTRPHIAVMRFVDGLDIRLMDLPPICKENGIPLNRIMRHIYRSKIIAYVVTAVGDENIYCTLERLRNCIRKSPMYNSNKLELVIVNKCDMIHKHALYNLDKLYYKLANDGDQITLVGVSATHKLGLQRLANTLRELLYPTQIQHMPRERVTAHVITLLNGAKTVTRIVE
uniref:GTP1/OBG family protein n=1 Tax=Babesia bovis TaxID=5865 RepID=S6BE09_BABBO|nr:GTP1/OBG family protein [Babesia bovis]